MKRMMRGGIRVAACGGEAEGIKPDKSIKRISKAVRKEMKGESKL